MVETIRIKIIHTQATVFLLVIKVIRVLVIRKEHQLTVKSLCAIKSNHKINLNWVKRITIYQSRTMMP